MSFRHQSINWHIVYIILPMTPFVLGGIIRYINTQNLCLATFSASDLAICLTLLSLSVNQSIIRAERLLNNPDKEDEAATHASIFLIFAILSLVLFTATIFYTSSIDDLRLDKFENSLVISQYATYALLPPIFILSGMAQQTFRLRATI